MGVNIIDGGNQRKPMTCQKSLTNFITYNVVSSTPHLSGFKLTTLVAISTDCIDIYKSNNHMIMTMMAPVSNWNAFSIKNQHKTTKHNKY
jgi:hypothetical protein